MSNPMRFFIVAGEASGDILGADLIIELKKQYPDAIFEGIAGERMQAAGCASIFPMDTLSVMGFSDVLKRLPAILNIHKKVVRYIKKDPPSVYIGIDSPDTNLRIAKKIKSTGVKIVQYVSPSVWAWRQSRLKTISASIDAMLTLFPFEAKFYHQHGIPAYCVGHTLADSIPLSVNKVGAREHVGFTANVPVLAILPGSREGEIERHAPVFLRTARRCKEQLPDLQFVVPLPNDARIKQFEFIWKDIAPELPIKILLQDTGTALAAADSVLTVSGTATLEAMLYKRNMIANYKISPFTFLIAKQLVRFRYMALPNLLADKRLVPEFLQEDVHEDNLTRHVIRQLTQPHLFEPIQVEFEHLHKQLRQNASAIAADKIKDLLG